MLMSRLRFLVPFLLLSSLSVSACFHQPTGPFAIEPYLQIGQTPAPDRLSVLWAAPASDSDAEWTVNYHVLPKQTPQSVKARPIRKIAVEGADPHVLYRAELTALKPGGRFSYQVLRDGQPVFSAQAPAPKSPADPYRVVLFGDGGDGSPNQKAVASRTAQEKPDLVVIPGDIVYDRGRVSEYLANFWPIYNSPEASPSFGAPLLRSIPFVASPGNHDIAHRDLDRTPDGLAYFFYWDQPLNGPDVPEGPTFSPAPSGSDTRIRAFRASAGSNYPRMANFSFNYGNAHWLLLDSNPYLNWSDETLRAWVENDLASAKKATWRFVAFHHPGFSSSRKHYAEQMMRRLAPVFETGKVDLVFSGHVHNYQRSYPLKFQAGEPGDDKPVLGKDGQPITDRRLVPGHWTLDKTFDGKTKTHPSGVIYLVTGAGGRHLYNPEQTDDPDSWQSFTLKFASNDFSLTVLDVDGPRLTVRQVAPDGQELDRFSIEK